MTANVDGRNARAQRTRQTIAEAHIGLINDGELKPAAKQIAARAGVSQRALWDNFKDMESVMANTAQRQLVEQDAAFEPVDVNLPLSERIRQYCLQRAGILETVAPLARAAEIQRPFSPVLQENLRENLSRIRDEAERLFRFELGRLDPPERLQTTLAICTASDWANWRLLREYLGQSSSEATRVMERALTSLLQSGASPPRKERRN
ncbi:TetR/AcrR family transcriptional regulator [Arthrobacter pigmenti]